MNQRTIIIHLIPPSSLHSLETAHSLPMTPRMTPRILCCRRRDKCSALDDDLLLQHFSDALLYLDKDASFAAIRDRFKKRWKPIYDIVNPFGDYRQFGYKAVWILDLRNDVLVHVNRYRRAELGLETLRTRSVTMLDLRSTGPPVPALVQPPLADPSLPVPSASLSQPSFSPQTQFWIPTPYMPVRNAAFLNRIFRDFNHKWRHILRSPFNTHTLRILARAVVRLATLDFTIVERDSEYGQSGQWVCSYDLPPWGGFTEDFVRVGDTWVVLCANVWEGVARARRHSSVQCATMVAEKENGIEDEEEEQGKRPTYMILSIKHIILCRSTPNQTKEFIHTHPEPLFNGTYNSTATPPDKALSYLVWALTPATPQIPTPLLRLPTELQDAILSHLYMGPVARAKLGILLSAGSFFSWKYDATAALQLQEIHGHYISEIEQFFKLYPEDRDDEWANWIFGRLDGADGHKYGLQPPRYWRGVESQIWFGDKCSGVVYAADWRKAREKK